MKFETFFFENHRASGNFSAAMNLLLYHFLFSPSDSHSAQLISDLYFPHKSGKFFYIKFSKNSLILLRFCN